MTPQDHNKVIGIMHLIWGGFNALTMLIVVPIILMMLEAMRRDPGSPPDVAVMLAVVGGVMMVFAFLFSVLPLLAGYAMLRRKTWARVMGFIAASVEAISMPFGTALCVYTIWFLLGPGEHFYRAGGGNMAGSVWNAPPLRDAGTFDWDAQRARQAGRQNEYVPPPQPPDWRGQ